MIVVNPKYGTKILFWERESYDGHSNECQDESLKLKWNAIYFIGYKLELSNASRGLNICVNRLNAQQSCTKSNCGTADEQFLSKTFFSRTSSFRDICRKQTHMGPKTKCKTILLRTSSKLNFSAFPRLSYRRDKA